MGVITHKGRDDFRLTVTQKRGNLGIVSKMGSPPYPADCRFNSCHQPLYSRSVVLSLEAALIGGGLVRKTQVS